MRKLVVQSPRELLTLCSLRFQRRALRLVEAPEAGRNGCKHTRNNEEISLRRVLDERTA